MNTPVQMNFKGKTYDTLFLLSFNEANFLIVREGLDIVNVDLDITNGIQTFSTPKNLDDCPNVSEHILVEYILESVRRKVKDEPNIDNNELKGMLSECSTSINNSEIKDVIKASNEHIKNGDFNSNTMSLISFIDKKLDPKVSLDFSSMTSFDILNNHYEKEIILSNKLDSIDDSQINNQVSSDIVFSTPVVENTIVYNDYIEATNEVPEVVEAPAVNQNVFEYEAPAANQSVIEYEAPVVDQAITEHNENPTVNNMPKQGEALNEWPPIESDLVIEKPKTLVKLFNNKRAAFADTLIISFIVGIVCGIYLAYLVIAII